MKPNLEADFFIGNRQKLRTLFSGTAPIVLTANSLLQKSTDTAYPFTQEGNFWYLTGLSEPDLILVIDKDKEYLIAPSQSEVRAAFDGSLDIKNIASRSGIKEILDDKTGWKKLGHKLKKSTSAAIISPAAPYIDSLSLYTNPAKVTLKQKLLSYNQNLTLLDLRQHLQRMRMVKQPEELIWIQKAVDITGKALKRVAKSYRDGRYQHEFEIELELTKLFHKYGADGHSFEPIVASGSKACVIHPQGNQAKIKPDDPLLLDIGAAFNNYAADISRTWATKPSRRFTAVYNSVTEVADFAKGLLKPGVLLKDYEKSIEGFMGEKLRELGLIKTVEHAEIRRYFPHSTSHFLGIDVHDVGDYDQALETGVVLTVEPGIYIPDEGIGVRIEDDILINQNGIVNLSGRIPNVL
ncbi:MAG TPA: aminopeptidase P N-terminal domain-containing protein [Patescibacteria group bacterium]|nr:aminopeptidase P N-terminal domain-containing protein [Patescibacteria group bacterium]